MNSRKPATGRAAELLADRALDILSPSDEQEMTELLATNPDLDETEFERTAAILAAIPLAESAEDMPDTVRQAIEGKAAEFLGVAQIDVETSAFSASDSSTSSTMSVPQPERPQISQTRTSGPAAVPPAFSSRLGWIAAAAAVVLALTGWLPRLTESEPPTAVELRDRLATLAADLDSSSWMTHKRWKDEELAVSGEVIWSDELQEGYMTIRGMPKNDAAKKQYQLWIYDEVHAAPKPPVDGGVFDCGDDGEIVIPIDARILVRNPSLFGITIEDAGGVVVSDQKELVLIAPIAG